MKRHAIGEAPAACGTCIYRIDGMCREPRSAYFDWRVGPEHPDCYYYSPQSLRAPARSDWPARERKVRGDGEIPAIW